jgi:hypothetical protein
VVAEPGDGSLDDPSVTIAAQGPSILGLIFREAITPMGRDHLDAEFGQRIVEGVAVVGLV